MHICNENIQPHSKESSLDFLSCGWGPQAAGGVFGLLVLPLPPLVPRGADSQALGEVPSNEAAVHQPVIQPGRLVAMHMRTHNGGPEGG